MRKGKNSFVRSVVVLISMVESPAVLPLIERNTDWTPFCITENSAIFPLSYSAMKKTSAPRTHKNALVVSTIFVSKVNLVNRLCLNTSTRTVQLIPPRMIRAPTKDRSVVLEKKFSKLLESGNMENPALLKADTERKADCHMASPR